MLSPQQSIEAYRVDPITFEAEVTTADPQLIREAIAYYQTAFIAFKSGDLKELPVMAVNDAAPQKGKFN